VSGRGAGWTGSGWHGWWEPLTEDAVPQGEPGLDPGPVRRQVQNRPALWLREPGRDGDDGAAQGRAPCDGLGGAGHRAGGAEQVVADRRAQGPGAVRREPARGYLQPSGGCPRCA
jgi:hypothetical protein